MNPDAELVDSHCHLSDAQFEGELDAVLERAFENGVRRCLVVGAGEEPGDWEQTLRLAERYDCLYAALGLHPHYARRASGAVFAELEKLLAHPKAVGLGEIGLDFHYDLSPRPQQREAFQEQLSIAARLQKPVIIHTREAWEETLGVLGQCGAPGETGGVMHCFTGGPAEAERCLELGFYLSFSGIVTYAKASAIQQAAAGVPDDRLLVETDAPYLAPVPYRGRRNEPAFLRHTAAQLASLRRATLEEVAGATTRNWERLFLRGGRRAG